MLKRTFLSCIAAVLSFVVAFPAFAFPLTGELLAANALGHGAAKVWAERPTRRSVSDQERDILKEIREGQRDVSVAMPQTSGMTKLMRGKMKRLFTRLKPGSDRYRTLWRPNVRSVRNLLDDGQSLAPNTIVQTGGSFGYDRPTRRDIRGE